jgi:DNA-binding MarR family transcriptional regulator
MADETGGITREEFWWLLVQVGHLSRRVAERWLATSGAAPDQLQALRVICDRTRITVGELARAMGLERNSASQLVERLVQDSLAGRERSTADRRQVFVTLSEKGQQLLLASAPEAGALASDLLSDLPPADLATTVRVLATIRERAAGVLQQTGAAVLPSRDGHGSA